MSVRLSSSYQQLKQTAFNIEDTQSTTRVRSICHLSTEYIKRGCFMRRVALFLSVLLGFSFTLIAASTAAPRLVAKVDLSQQRMSVYINGRKKYSWPVSTGRRGYRTPVGSWRPKVLRRMHYSKKYYNSPMPHSVFYLGGFAVHGTGAIKRLGRPASHGCVRLHPRNARRLFGLIKAHGMGNSRIKVVR